MSEFQKQLDELQTQITELKKETSEQMAQLQAQLLNEVAQRSAATAISIDGLTAIKREIQYDMTGIGFLRRNYRPSL